MEGIAIPNSGRMGHAGISKTAYIRKRRTSQRIPPADGMHYAENASETITTVSQNCGFHSASYFGKVFRSQMGCTPYEFKYKIGTGNL